GRPATWGNGTQVAFVADTKEDVRAFHDTALRLGGSSEGEPGPRPHYGENYFAAYVRDPDGNKLQAVCYASED
ncbi:MAG: VOC family protein, partial [Epibacterium sp.]|nr:VOC family protein [Epibacterium sp.]NQX75494.1 VOC family protein [Epibacterium sp.]